MWGFWTRVHSSFSVATILLLNGTQCYQQSHTSILLLFYRFMAGIVFRKKYFGRDSSSVTRSIEKFQTTKMISCSVKQLFISSLFVFFSRKYVRECTIHTWSSYMLQTNLSFRIFKYYFSGWRDSIDFNIYSRKLFRPNDSGEFVSFLPIT